MESLSNINEPTAVLLQPCGHNPTGVDPTTEQWYKIIKLLKQKKNILPFVDMAYFGFASGSFTQDKYVITKLMECNKMFIVCNSFAKNFGMYGERVGSLSIVTESETQSQIARSKLN